MRQMAKFSLRNHLLLLLLALLLGLLLSSLTEDYLRPKFTNILLRIQGISERIEGRTALDSEGIPQFFVGSTPRAQRNIVTIAHQAQRDWQVYQESGDETTRQRFINIADWYVENAMVREGDFVVWEHTYSLPAAATPWVSTLGQGLAIQVLAQAHQLTDDNIYLETARQALGSFTHDIADGGVRIQDDNGGWWYEHFATPQTTHPSRTLNAMAYSLWALWDYYEYSEDELAKELFKRGMLTLLQHVPEYDAGVWSYYDANGTLANPNYHRENINSLRVLYQITSEPLLLEYSQRWEGYANSKLAWVIREFTLEQPFIVRRFLNEQPQEIDFAILLCTCLLVWVILELAYGGIRLTTLWIPTLL